MNAQTIRCRNDPALYNRLLKHRDVIKVDEFIARKEDTVKVLCWD